MGKVCIIVSKNKLLFNSLFALVCLKKDGPLFITLHFYVELQDRSRYGVNTNEKIK